MRKMRGAGRTAPPSISFPITPLAGARCVSLRAAREAGRNERRRRLTENLHVGPPQTVPLGEGAHRRYSALIWIVVPLAAGVLGRVTVSSPFLNVALTLVPSTATGRRTLRVKAPYVRSMR